MKIRYFILFVLFFSGLTELLAAAPPRRSYNRNRRSLKSSLVFVGMQYTTDHKFGAQVYFPLSTGRYGRNQDFGMGLTGRMSQVTKGAETVIKADMLVNFGYKVVKGIHVVVSPGIQTKATYEKGFMAHPDYPEIEVPYTDFKSAYTYAIEAGLMYELNDWNRSRRGRTPVYLYTGYHIFNGFTFGAGLTF
ncbi:hypothetical protein [Persicobacter sp. CCB-QB2]|uniref:hypothetical protein n=1 Tax=Persicobacter sp. CCB-QB2 TaxID=1561025 RepID=UPI0006A94B24|nr:hypothetical protein [Persicobacter sp. CCB-QB2]